MIKEYINKIKLFQVIICQINYYTNTYTNSESECSKSSQNRRLSSLSDEDCSQLETNDDNTQKCIYSPSQGKCIEIDKDKSECTSKAFSKRLSTELTDDYCEPLKTSNDNKYICASSDDGKSCEEVEGSNGLKLSLAILCLLLFL